MVRACSKGTWEKTHKMERASNCGVMAATIMENIEMDKNMDKESIIGQTALNMQESGKEMKCMVQVNSYGQMEENTKEHSWWGWWKGRAVTNGEMAGNTMANMLRIRRQAMVFTCTLTAADSRVNGGMASRMAWGTWSTRVGRARGRGSG
jgi:hypothetical protein